MEKEKKCPECTHRIKKRTEEETIFIIKSLNRISWHLRGKHNNVQNGGE